MGGGNRTHFIVYANMDFHINIIFTMLNTGIEISQGQLINCYPIFHLNIFIFFTFYTLCLFTRYDQEVLGLMYFRIPRSEKFDAIFQYNLPSS